MVLLPRQSGLFRPEYSVNEKEAQLYTCQSCGKKYIVRKCEAQYFAKGNDRHYCVPCRKAFRAKLEREREEQEDLIWQRKKAEDQKLFESLLPTWNLKDLSAEILNKEKASVRGADPIRVILLFCRQDTKEYL